MLNDDVMRSLREAAPNDDDFKSIINDPNVLWVLQEYKIANSLKHPMRAIRPDTALAMMAVQFWRLYRQHLAMRLEEAEKRPDMRQQFQVSHQLLLSKITELEKRIEAIEQD